LAHKTFISYKYSEAKELRDKIINCLGEEGAKYYKGETSESPNLTGKKTESIRKYLKDMIYETSVMIVIISPNMKDSNWIDWEIEYALKDIKHGDRTSHSNGILGVIMNESNKNWFKYTVKKDDGDICSEYNTNYTYKIINENRFNQNPKEYSCELCKTVASLTGSYISFVKEDDFLKNPNFYIDNAYDKSQRIDNYEIKKYVDEEHVATL